MTKKLGQSIAQEVNKQTYLWF